MNLTEFYKGKNVLITGHTGFKGAWLCEILKLLGAAVTGYSLETPTEPSMFNLCEIEKGMTSVIGDIRDLNKLGFVFEQYKPEIIFHLAAQPIVREGYKNPVQTFETNIMGTVNVLECVQQTECVKSLLNITTDKVYRNNEWTWGYRENDELCGSDPYSNSKSCSELVTFSYMKSFLSNDKKAVSTARAGNVIGGGDFAADRIIPDCVRAAQNRKDIIVRNPQSTRPYQHVLDALFGYLLIAQKQFEDISFADNYNIGPDNDGCCETGKLVDLFSEKWGGLKRVDKSDNGCHEANFLKLDCSKIKARLGWKPVWNLETAITKTVEWSKLFVDGSSTDKLKVCTDKQINEFILAGGY